MRNEPSVPPADVVIWVTYCKPLRREWITYARTWFEARRNAINHFVCEPCDVEVERERIRDT